MNEICVLVFGDTGSCEDAEHIANGSLSVKELKKALDTYSDDDQVIIKTNEGYAEIDDVVPCYLAE